MDCRFSKRSRCPLPRLILATALGLLGCGEGLAETPEFNGIETRGFVSNPSGLAYWQFGDDDGDGVVDGSDPDAPPVPIRSTLSTIASTNQVNAPQSSYSAGDSSLDNAIRDSNGGIVGIAVDYQDFYYLPAPNSFAGVLGSLSASTVQSRPLFVQMGGVEVMQTLQFTTKPAKEESSEPVDSIDLAVGGRFFDFSSADPFVMQGLTSMSVATAVTNQISGPQASVAWNRQSGRWQTMAASSLMVGYCDIEGSQNVSINNSLVPGRLNQPVLLTSTNANNSLDANDIAPLAELRLRASYDVTSSAALFLGYNLLYLGALRTPADSILWSLPSMGMLDRGGDDLSVSTLSMGIEWTH
jgi:hypothetical protein